jgi:hypothetical protein
VLQPPKVDIHIPFRPTDLLELHNLRDSPKNTSCGKAGCDTDSGALGTHHRCAQAPEGRHISPLPSSPVNINSNTKIVIDTSLILCYASKCSPITPSNCRRTPLFPASPSVRIHPFLSRPIPITLVFSMCSPLFCTLLLQVLCSQCVPQINPGVYPHLKRSQS